MRDINKLMPKISNMQWGAVIMMPTDLERFWSKVEKTGNCWLWTAAKYRQGYGVFRLNKKNHSAHILSFEMKNGEVPQGLELDHLCRNPSCVNPDHLEAVTHQINCIRGISPAAINAIKIQCPNGHEFTPENTYHRPSRPHQRECKICKNESSKNWNKQNSKKISLFQERQN